MEPAVGEQQLPLNPLHDQKSLSVNDRSDPSSHTIAVAAEALSEARESKRRVLGMEIGGIGGLGIGAVSIAFCNPTTALVVIAVSGIFGAGLGFKLGGMK